MSSATPTVGRWFKSSRSASNAQCVEVRFADAVGVRDSKDRSGPALAVSPYAWRTFISTVKSCGHNLT